jgi:hypothetical protein
MARALITPGEEGKVDRRIEMQMIRFYDLHGEVNREDNPERR